MDFGTLSKTLASVAAVGLMAAWMMPPTRPKPLAPSPLIGLARVKPMALPSAAAPAQPPAMLPTTATPPRTEVVALRAQPAFLVARDSELATVTVERTAVEPARASVDPPGQDDSDQDPYRDNARYREGLRWARFHDVEEPRDCPSAPGDPAQQGCVDYARAQDLSSDVEAY
jgi:hypothetical protein